MIPHFLSINLESNKEFEIVKKVRGREKDLKIFSSLLQIKE